ncbi:MAG: 30S ribosomal protein S4, partial [Candidatus Diapherotrites archaeon]|nr:30S ribosomal protein S4 [Candidatus Diapherotrites archaeon]
RKLLAQPFEARKQREKELLDSLIGNGVLKNNAALDDVLGLKVEAILERRLETLAWKQGLSATLSQARQLITHGHIGIAGKKMTAPGYIVKKDEESRIGFLDKALEIKIKKAAQKKKEIKPKIPEKAPEAQKAAATAIVPEEEKLPAPVLEIAEKEIEKAAEEPAKKEKAKAAKPAKKEKPKEKKEAKPEGEVK